MRRVASVCFLMRGRRGSEQVCLSEKLRTYGVGVLNGYGGKRDGGETIVRCAVRETFQECGVLLLRRGMRQVALISLVAPAIVWELHIFTARVWRGEPRESKEHGPPQWHSLSHMPYERMFPDNRFWLRKALRGKPLDAIVRVGADGRVRRVVYRPPTFATRSAR